VLDLVAKAYGLDELAAIDAAERKGPTGGRRRVLKAITARLATLKE